MVAGGTQLGEACEDGWVPMVGHGARWQLYTWLAGWGTCTALTEFALSLVPRLIALKWVNPQEDSGAWCTASRRGTKCLCSPASCRWLSCWEAGWEMAPARCLVFREVSQHTLKSV